MNPAAELLNCLRRPQGTGARLPAWKAGLADYGRPPQSEIMLRAAHALDRRSLIPAGWLPAYRRGLAPSPMEGGGCQELIRLAFG